MEGNRSQHENAFNFKVYKTEEFLDDLIEEPVIEVNMQNVEEFINENKWKHRDQAYQFIEEQIQSEDQEQREKGKRIFADHFDQILSEKNLAAQKSGLKLILAYTQQNEIHSNYFLPLMNFLFENVSKKSNFLIQKIIIILYNQSDEQVVDFLLKQCDSKNQHDIKTCMKLLNQIMQNTQLKSQSVVKQMIFRLKEFLNHPDLKVRNLTQNNYQLLFSYLEDDFEDLEKNLFSDLKEMQIKSLKNSMINIQKNNNSFFLLKNSKFFQNSTSQGNLHQDNQSTVLHLDQLLPEKFQELPYIQNIEEKINILENLLQNTQNKQFTLKSSNLNQVINILINETETSNYLVYSLTIEILQIMLSKKSINEFTEGQIKQIITQISAKYLTKQNLDKTIIEILTQILQKRHLSQKKLLKFVFSEIDSVSSLNVKQCYLDFVVHNYQNFDHSKIQKSARKKSSRNKSVYKQKSIQVSKKNNIQDSYILDQLKKFLKNEKKIKVKKIYKQAIEKIEQNETLNQQVQKSQLKKNKSQNIVMKSRSSMDLKESTERNDNSQIVQNPEQQKYKDHIYQLCCQKKDTEIIKVSLEVYVKLQPTQQQLHMLLQEILKNNGLYTFLQIYQKTSMSQGNRQNIEKHLQQILKQKEVILDKDDIDQVYFYLQNNQNINISNQLKEILNKELDQTTDKKQDDMQQKLDKHKQEFQEIFTTKKTPLDSFMDQMNQINNQDTLLQFIKDIQKDQEFFMQLKESITFNQIQQKIEDIFLNYIASNEDQVIELSEFFVVMLKLFSDTDKKKFFVLILTLCSQLRELNALFLFPFFNDVDDIFECFELSFSAVYKEMQYQNTVNFVHNCFPVFFAKFSQSEINLNNKNFKCLIPTIIFGLEMQELSKTCFDIIQHIQIQHSKNQLMQVSETKLVQHQKLYQKFLQFVEKIQSENSVVSQSEEDNQQEEVDENLNQQKEDNHVSIDNKSVQSEEVQLSYLDTQQNEQQQIEQRRDNENQGSKKFYMDDQEQYNEQEQQYEQQNQTQKMEKQNSKNSHEFQRQQNFQEDSQILNSSQVKNLEQLRNRKKLQKLQGYSDENQNNSDEAQLLKMINKYKEDLQREKDDHKKTITKLINLNKKFDEVKIQLNQKTSQNQLQKQDTKKKKYQPLKVLDVKMIQGMCHSVYSEEVFDEYFEEFKKLENYQRENTLFDLKYQLLDSFDFNVFDYILLQNIKNLLKMLVNIISYIVVNDLQENCFVLTQSIIDSIVTSCDYQNSIIILMQIIDENLPNYQDDIIEDKKQFIKYNLKCIEKLISKVVNGQSGTKIHQNCKLITELYKLFSNHKPEDLDEKCKNLDFFDEVFRILRYFSDLIIKFDVQGANNFTQLFQHDNSIFVTYVKKYLAALNNQFLQMMNFHINYKYYYLIMMLKNIIKFKIFLCLSLI